MALFNLHMESKYNEKQKRGLKPIQVSSSFQQQYDLSRTRKRITKIDSVIHQLTKKKLQLLHARNMIIKQIKKELIIEIQNSEEDVQCAIELVEEHEEQERQKEIAKQQEAAAEAIAAAGIATPTAFSATESDIENQTTEGIELVSRIKECSSQQNEPSQILNKTPSFGMENSHFIGMSVAHNSNDSTSDMEIERLDEEDIEQQQRRLLSKFDDKEAQMAVEASFNQGSNLNQGECQQESKEDIQQEQKGQQKEIVSDIAAAQPLSEFQSLFQVDFHEDIIQQSCLKNSGTLQQQQQQQQQQDLSQESTQPSLSAIFSVPSSSAIPNATIEQATPIMNEVCLSNLERFEESLLEFIRQEERDADEVLEQAYYLRDYFQLTKQDLIISENWYNSFLGKYSIHISNNQGNQANNDCNNNTDYNECNNINAEEGIQENNNIAEIGVGL